MMVCHSIMSAIALSTAAIKELQKKYLKSKKNQVIWRQIIEEKIIRPQERK